MGRLPMPSETPVVFVHLGPTLPNYLAANLRLTAAHSGLEVVLITDADLTGIDCGPVCLVPISREWYSGEMSLAFRARTTLSSDFRGGFWLAAAERFFVLLEFMRAFDVQRLIHAESDVLVFDLRPLVPVLLRRPDMAFFPFPYREFIIPSLCLFSGVEPLERVAEWLVSAADHRTEMELLAAYAREHPDDVLFLPTDAWFGPRPTDWRSGVHTLSPEETSGIVDANALGQWLFGRDPRNHAGPGWNRYQNPNAEHELSGLRFDWNPEGELQVSAPARGADRVPVLNLHIHSKVHRRIERSGLLQRVLANIAEDRRTLITPGMPPTLRPGRTLLPSRMAQAMRLWRFRGL